MTLEIFSLITFFYSCFLLIDSYFGFRSIKNLGTQANLANQYYPSITIILSALNEETAIEKTIQNLLQLSYPHFDIIAVNDRSTDNTGKLLDRLAHQYSKLKVIHIEALPPGWLGKNHALHQAASLASGDWILFTDADAILKKDILKKTMAYVIEHKLKHLTMLEFHSNSNLWLKLGLFGSYLGYTMSMAPWRIKKETSQKALGHGAFNLIEKKTYQACKGHAAIALECLDDLKLGELIKKNGFMQDTVDGRDYLERDWYCSLKTMIQGMKKNSFAYYDYNLLKVVRDCCFAIFFYLLPIFCLFFGEGVLQIISGFNVILVLAFSSIVAKHFRVPLHYILFYPFSMLILVITVLNSAFFVCKNKGIIWRGTYYPLSMIRSNDRVRWARNGR